MISLHFTMRWERAYNVSEWFAKCTTYLGFEYLFNLAENEWEMLMSQQWFPFISKGRYPYGYDQLPSGELVCG